MPDMKTALTTALAKDLDDWDNEETSRTTAATAAPAKSGGKKLFPIINNVARETFDAVKNNPGLTAVQYVALLSKKGFKESSTTSILSQLVSTGQVARNKDTRALTPINQDYTPIRKPKVEAQVKPKAKVQEGGNTHHSAGGIATLSKAVSVPWTPESIINKLTLPQAKELYNALRNYFG